MVSRAGVVLLFFTLLSGLAGPIPQAQAAPLKDYTRVTENGKYLLVMLAPDGTGQPDPALRQKYSQPGLYPNDGSLAPVWTTDWTSWYQNLPDSQLYTTLDGKYMVRVDRATDLALAFYVTGIEVKRYGLYELRPDLLVQSGERVWQNKANLDSAQKRFVVETVTGERLEFNTTTGQRLPGIGKPDSLGLVVGLVAIGLFTLPIGVIAFIGIKRQLKRKESG